MYKKLQNKNSIFKGKTLLTSLIFSMSFFAFTATTFMPNTVLAVDSNKKETTAAPAGTEAPNCTILPAELCANSEGKDISKNSVWLLLILALNILTAGIGVAAVAGVVYAAVLYTTAADSAEKVKKSKDILVQIAWGVVLYGFMFVLLNFLIPGGIFNA